MASAWAGGKMKRFMLGIVFFAVSFTIRAQDITYDLVSYPADQGGCTLSGSITTDGTIGPLSASNVQSWEYTITDGDNTCSYTSGYNPGLEAGAVGVISCFNSVSASPTQLLLTASDITYEDGQGPGISLLILQSSIQLTWANYTGTGVEYNEPWYFYQNDMQNLNWSTWNPQMGGKEPWVVAQTATVPEPSTLMLLLAGGVGLLACVLRKRGC
jgi:hypothetical protein